MSGADDRSCSSQLKDASLAVHLLSRTKHLEEAKMSKEVWIIFGLAVIWVAIVALVVWVKDCREFRRKSKRNVVEIKREIVKDPRDPTKVFYWEPSGVFLNRVEKKKAKLEQEFGVKVNVDWRFNEAFKKITKAFLIYYTERKPLFKRRSK